MDRATSLESARSKTTAHYAKVHSLQYMELIYYAPALLLRERERALCALLASGF